ncbi:DNA-binding transcriptional regulator, MarR family [Anaerocolumna jejuensis DSM 15929]|uniref:DNA-binding transcriptional regulator, MarR family n=1 Tax=Anaerocolumna jejuensis DSM 15929 TaxID=1121322 RepID=A0A1M6XHJ9_9FIRM|nr:MarR family winged helix-turn-helix transcriptional regulator [Anaerocolumna jejuensis]SHL05416.1 DNA-binding transcriptional regulator, MarR family [Anaerocolumna jejuensis DSM 15929]
MLNSFDILINGHQFKKLYEREYDWVMKKYNLKKIEIEILYFISQCGEHNTAKDIAQIQYISKAHISNSIEDLSHKKYISVIGDSTDRRYMHLNVTESASPVIEDIEKVREHLLDILFHNITEEESELMIRISKKIVDNISEELK